jgi:hypothetical protein
VEERPETAEVVASLLRGHLERAAPGYGTPQVLHEVQRLKDETTHDDCVELV